jgi:hypothetical protein
MPGLALPGRRMIFGCRQKSYEDRQPRGWNIQFSCAPKCAERLFDFLLGRYTAALGLIDRFKLLRRGMIYAAATGLYLARVFGQLLLVLLGPRLHLFKQLFRARAHTTNIA